MSHYSPQRHTPNNLKTSHQVPPFKGSTTSQQHLPGDQAFNTAPLGNSQDPNSSRQPLGLLGWEGKEYYFLGTPFFLDREWDQPTVPIMKPLGRWKQEHSLKDTHLLLCGKLTRKQNCCCFIIFKKCILLSVSFFSSEIITQNNYTKTLITEFNQKNLFSGCLGLGRGCVMNVS